MSQPFDELSLLLLITAIFGAIAVKLRQPVLIAYIAVGIISGPAGFGLVTAHDQIDLLAQMGVAVLLFLVGLKLDLQHVRHIGPVALATGLGQLAFTIIIGFGLTLLMGRDWLTALYVAVALTFSSTIIIVKLLSDKRELDSLHGRIAVGFLIVQDIAVVFAMIVMSTLHSDSIETSSSNPEWQGVFMIGSLLLRILLAAGLLYLFMRHILPPLVRQMAKSQELLLIFAVAWGTALAALGDWAGFSKEAGAFLAGFSLASTYYRDAISARLTGLRDFLLLFFFIDLGTKLDFAILGGELWMAIVLSVFVLIGNPLIVMSIMGYMGYRKRTGFMAGLTVAQISEFSIVFVAMGITLGHIGQDALGLTTLVGIVTIALSTYMILYSQTLYEWLAPWLGLFERRQPYRELMVETQYQVESQPRIIIFGLGRYGMRLLEQLQLREIPVLGVDFDPEAVRTMQRRKLQVRFGDAEDPAFLESLPLAGTRWIITTLPEWAANRSLILGLRQASFTGKIGGVVRDASHEKALIEAGAHKVINPFNDAADHAAETFIQDFQSQEQKP